MGHGVAMDAWDVPGDDLFGVAAALADIVGAPVTIEDTDTTVLAYSGSDQSVDEARIQTILGRRTPEPFRSALQEAGVYKRVAAETGVVVADLPDIGMRPRAIVGVRDGDELIGSIWLALHAPLDEARERALLDAARVVAAHLRRNRSTLDAVRTARSEQLAVLLAGGEPAVAAARNLGATGRPVTAVAFGAAGPAAGRGADAELDRAASALLLHLSAVEARSSAAVLGDRVYAVVSADDVAARRIVGQFLSRRADDLVAGVGRSVPTVQDLARSRTDADEALVALMFRGTGGRVAGPADVLLDTLVLRMADVVESAELRDLGPLARLEEFDSRHGTDLAQTATVHLDCGGDVRAAAGRLHVHPNTVRNRIRKMRDVCAVDLDDADTRLLLMLMSRIDTVLRPAP